MRDARRARACPPSCDTMLSRHVTTFATCVITQSEFKHLHDILNTVDSQLVQSVVAKRFHTSVNMASNLLFCFVLISTWLVFTSSKTLCPRIFFQNINEETMPYKVIEGVYIKENDSYNGFPVYRREGNRNLGLYFQTYHIGDDYYNYLHFGNIFGDGSLLKYGVTAKLYPTSVSAPLFWLMWGTVNKRDMFYGIVQYWEYFIRKSSVHYAYNVPTTASSPMIKAVCVDEDFRECNSDRVYLNERIDDKNENILNDPTTDYFYRIEGLFRSLRPVYKHSAVSWYLQYVDTYWVISESYRPSTSEENVVMRVKDLALRPEYITNTWTQWSFGWRDMPNLRVFCRGVTSMSNICPSNPCHNNATCVYTSGNETLCICTSGFTGTRCSVNKQCPTPRPAASTELGLKYLEKRPGNLAVSFCDLHDPFDRFRPRFYLCVDGDDNPFWSGQGLACKENNNERSTTASPTTTYKNPTTTYTPPTTSYTPPSPSIVWPILFMPILLSLIMTYIWLPLVPWSSFKSCKKITTKKTTIQEWNKLVPTDLPLTNLSTDEWSYKEPLDVLVAQAIIMPVFKKPSRMPPPPPSYYWNIGRRLTMKLSARRRGLLMMMIKMTMMILIDWVEFLKWSCHLILSYTCCCFTASKFTD